jgi:hypothetical protein
MTIALDRARAVLAMRAAGATHLKIVEKLGIARSTVRRILRGESPHELPERVQADPDPDYAARPVRCKCGRLVILEPGESRCLACRLERPAAAEAACEVSTREPQPVTAEELLCGIRIPFALKPEHRARYEAVHRRRREADMIGGGDDGQPGDVAGPSPADLARIEMEDAAADW